MIETLQGDATCNWLLTPPKHQTKYLWSKDWITSW